MRKIASALLLVVALLVFTVSPSWAGGRGGSGHGGGGNKGWGHRGGHSGHSHFHSTVVVGGGWWWGYPYWYYPPYYPYYYPYYYPPQPPEEPPVYIEQSTQATQPTTPRASTPASYWYYCQSAAAYFPHVQSCPEAWIKVAPRTE